MGFAHTGSNAGQALAFIMTARCRWSMPSAAHAQMAVTVPNMIHATVRRRWLNPMVNQTPTAIGSTMKLMITPSSLIRRSSPGPTRSVVAVTQQIIPVQNATSMMTTAAFVVARVRAVAAAGAARQSAPLRERRTQVEEHVGQCTSMSP